MICSSFEVDFLRFLCRSVRAMGCFFGCFRIKDDHRPSAHLVSEPVPSDAREPIVSRTRSLSLLLSEEKESLSCKDSECQALGTALRGFDGIDLKDEAKFLKACGTVIDIPTEIQKKSENLKGSSSHGDSESSKFHSWLPNASIEKLMEKPPQKPLTPIKFGEKWETESVLSECTPSSCVSNGNTGRRFTSSMEDSGRVGSVGIAIKIDVDQTHEATSVSPRHLAANGQSRNKSVRFECDSDLISHSSISFSSDFASQNQVESEGNYSVSKPSPFPTPCNLSNEMQTPGTVFPAYLENKENGKNPRIRSQFVYSVLNPVENFTQWKTMKEEDTNFNQLPGHLRESLDQADNATSKSEMEIPAVQNQMKVETSLSSWLKPLQINQEDSIQQFDSGENAHFGRTPGDRPILGMVAAHWNEDKLSRISPKWWDGNGIPNSTNKYKEDQKVSWHATPFEERLEKALSEDSLVSQRKHINGTSPVDLKENEENDTALSQLRSPAHFKAVASF